ncbi:MAG: iron-only hydrogenase system regulator [Clostridiales bacterium]|jgi:putative iron-only hydrogenase system regulator|nr:iron-only hydrogenase system regulator [Clostridiales bacterium]
MESKIAVVAIIVSDVNAVDKINSLLHNFADYIIGRMGLPYKQKNVNVISVVMDAPQEIINSLSGKLGMINGVSSKVLTTK